MSVQTLNLVISMEKWDSRILAQKLEHTSNFLGTVGMSVDLVTRFQISNPVVITSITMSILPFHKIGTKVPSHITLGILISSLSYQGLHFNQLTKEKESDTDFWYWKLYLMVLKRVPYLYLRHSTSFSSSSSYLFGLQLQ